MDRFILGNLLVEGVGVLDRAIDRTSSATRAFLLNNVPGISDQADLKIPCFSLNVFDLCIGQNLYVWMPADLDQFGGQDSHRAVIGGEGLVQLGHVPPDAGGLFHQINLETGDGQVQRSLDPADPSTNDHHIADIPVAKIVNLFFFQWFVP
jgi:hypothetical protein